MDNAVFRGHGFQCPDGGGADADDAAAAAADAVQRFGCLFGHLAELTVHHMLFRVFHLDRAEGAEPHMQQDRDNGDAFGFDPLQQLRGEMEAGGGSGGGAFLLRVYGLVTVRVGELFVDIGRQGHFAQPVQHFFKDTVAMETDDPSADLFHVIQHLTAEQPVPEGTDGSGAEPAAGTDKRLPVRGAAAAEQQYLHRHAGILLDAKQAGGDHLGLVDDQGIAGVEVVDDIVEVLMFDLPAVPVVNQQAAVVPGFHGGLGDQLFGKVIVEVGSFHGVQISILIWASAVAGMFFFR